MIIIISARDSKLESLTDPRFGRAAWFIKVNTETDKWEAFPNPAAAQSGGAGVAAAQFVIDQKANAVVSGDFGPNASRTFKSANIVMHLFTQEVKTVQDAIDHFKQNKLPVF